MADPKIKVVIEAEGVVKEGEMRPEVGARVEARFGDAAKCRIGIDYRDPDSLKLTLAGDLRLRITGEKRVRVSGAVERSLLDGTTDFRGSVRYEIPRSAAVEITTELAEDEDKIGAKVTLQF